jgi:simple sugar transport system substrate-binding protein
MKIRGGRHGLLVSLIAALALVAAACDGGGGGEETTEPTGEETSAPAEPLVFGMILVGPKDDNGWSEAHYNAGKYLEEKLGAEGIYLDKVNIADRPETTVDQVANDMIEQGAQLIFATSDDMKDGILAAAAQKPDVPMIWSSGDSAWAEGEDYHADLTNLGNTMPQMEYGKMIAGCAAALSTQTGKIGYLGPLINDETRRLVNSAYLGAKYCWENYRGEDPSSLQFDVNWIGFWFNIPGVTLDPTKVANDFFDKGADVVMSGIDTPEATTVAGQRHADGEDVWSVAYDYEAACDTAPDACLGVPYFNWRPAYLAIAQSVLDGTFEASWDWAPPDWTDINNEDTSAVGFIKGEALSEDASANLDEFISGLADGSINLYTGPLNWQDGSQFLADGQTANEQQIWYTEQLLEGMKGASVAPE